jgi:hypothetical protein
MFDFYAQLIALTVSRLGQEDVAAVETRDSGLDAIGQFTELLSKPLNQPVTPHERTFSDRG